jgi:hypothetical protein
LRRSRASAVSVGFVPAKSRSKAARGLVSFGIGVAGPAHETLREYAQE